MSRLTPVDITRSIAYLRSTFRNRGIVLLPDSILQEYIQESENFVNQTNKKPLSEITHQAENEMAAIANQLFFVARIAESCQHLRASRLLTKRIREVASMRTTIPDQIEQFHDNEYELFCAAQFVSEGSRVNFVRDRGASLKLNQSNVEFLIDNRFPVECKRPRSTNRIVPIIREAAEKIGEWNSDRVGKKSFAPGVVCIALDCALRNNKPFQQFADHEDFAVYEKKWAEVFGEKHGDMVVEIMRSNFVEAVMFHYDTPVYYHFGENEGCFARPMSYLGFTKNNRWFAPPAVLQCLNRLEAVRVASVAAI